MKRTRITTLLVLLVVLAVTVSVNVRTTVWWHRETAAGHHLAISTFQTWGLYSGQGETLVAYPPGEPDGNTVFEHHQYGPISDDSDHPAYKPALPICKW